VGEKLEIIKIPDIELAFAPDSEVVLPESIKAVYNDSACTDELPVVWNEDEIQAIDTSVTGSYTVSGVASVGELSNQADSDGNIIVSAAVTISNINLLQNPSFEDDDTSMWVVTPISGDNPSDFQNKSSDATDGSFSFHFWSQSDMEFTVEQTVTVDTDGTYSATVNMQGGDFNPDADIYLYVKVGDEATEYTSNPVKLDGWCKWKNPTIKDIQVAAGDKVTVGAYVKCDALAWATFDEFSLTLN